MTLKTLKDFEQHSHINHRTGIAYRYVCFEDLKDEIIEWIKEFRKEMKELPEGIEKCEEGYKLKDIEERDIFFMSLGRSQAIHSFFNITEEESK